MEQITKFFTDNLERLKALGADLNDKVDVLFKSLKAISCEEFCNYIIRKEEQYTNGTLSFTAHKLFIVAQKQYALMKTRGTFIKSQTMEHEVVAMRAEIGQLKGKLTLLKNVEQAGDEKTGGGTNKQCQKRDVAWKKIPPKSD